MRPDRASPLAEAYSQLPAFRGRNQATAVAAVQKAIATERKDRFEETLVDITREYDEALMAQSTKCKVGNAL